MSFIQSAFDAVCKESKQPGSFFVCLMEQVQRYGGPEEGGWWTTDSQCVAYQEYPTETDARAAAAAVEVLAEELSEQERHGHDLHCLNQCEWLEARGLDADFLPENDGPTRYHVAVSDFVPAPSFGPTHYE